jgi:hypothetical protein
LRGPFLGAWRSPDGSEVVLLFHALRVTTTKNFTTSAVTPTQWRAYVGDAVTRAAHAHGYGAQATTVAGVPALAITGPTSSSVEWMVGPVKYDVTVMLGQPEQALKIARSLGR